ncbi:MAG: helix-turn-helix domain-containing protein [Gammaproteobacteria bacterium]
MKTSNSEDRKKRWKRLRNKQYRDAYVASQISIAIPFQVKKLREQNEMDQKKLAKMAGMKQPRISAIENGNGQELSLNTLRRLASAFDVALIVRFAPFSELFNWVEGRYKVVNGFHPNSFNVTPYIEDNPESVTKSQTLPYHAARQQGTTWEVSSASPFSYVIGQSQVNAKGVPNGI